MTSARAVLDHQISEREFMQQVIDLARLNGWLAYHVHDSRRSWPGFPDLVLVRPPRCLFVELKTERGRLTDWQFRWIYEINGCTEVKADVWRPSGWKEIEHILSAPRRAALACGNADLAAVDQGEGCDRAS